MSNVTPLVRACRVGRDRMKKGQFTLRDLYQRLSSALKMGPMNKVMGMIPGMGEMAQVKPDSADLRMMGLIFRSLPFNKLSWRRSVASLCCYIGCE